ncbi:MAG TPA: class I SAM-dependent methyltransferase [Thermomicrobiales bacterium]
MEELGAEDRSLVSDVRERWEAKAAFWDERMGDGNAFQRILIGPACERLLAVQPGEQILDVACGNGVFARRLSALGARVVAVDFSERFLELAKTRGAPPPGEIDYRLVDATDEEQLLALGEGRFDAAVCNMALMDMPVIAPLFRAVRRLLVPGGRFVFSIQHPAFNSNAVQLGAETSGRDLSGGRYVKIFGYLSVPPGLGAGMPGEPTPHWYFHRPLSEVFGDCFAAGFVLDGLEEPAFGPEHATAEPLSWLNYTDIPPVLVARMRPAG